MNGGRSKPIEIAANGVETDSSGRTRREFIRTLVVAGGSALALGLIYHEWPRPRRIIHVIILGAGLAGLCAAYELGRLGHLVTILEAEQNHLGGRVRTFRFEGGLYGELGAMRIPQSHLLTHHYIRLFDLPLRPFVEFNPEAFYYVGGRHRRIKDVGRLDTRYAVQSGGLGAVSIWKEPFTEIIGGLDRLPAAFVERLQSRPRGGSVVNRIEQDYPSRRAAVIYREGSVAKRVEGDFILCTIPFPALQAVTVSPPWSAAKEIALRQLKYSSASKTLVAVERRFWEADDGIFGGATYTDLPTGMIYYPSDNARVKNPRVSAGPGVLVGSYALGKSAKKLDALTPAQQSALVQGSVQQVHPQLGEPGIQRQIATMNWDQHPWSGGAFAQVDNLDQWRQAGFAAEGRVHFAGEHTSLHPTWMQGALESALRAVREILAAAAAMP
ncbi:MAG: FAD-dependent oxidoreductase [Armatimonadota bacterium]|nr:FAD-dependent oxidoreductase [Armatimonadota bacterium]